HSGDREEPLVEAALGLERHARDPRAVARRRSDVLEHARELAAVREPDLDEERVAAVDARRARPRDEELRLRRLALEALPDEVLSDRDDRAQRRPDQLRPL